MKTYDQRKAELQLRKDGAFWYIGSWRYYERLKFAENLSTGEVFRADWDTFLIEKNIIDMLSPV
jgi:hypothetical protein